METWFKRRGYQHFDRPVGASFAAKAMQPQYVAEHSFSPLIHYVKEEKRFKKTEHKTKKKKRDIMYASHRDACILSYYADTLNKILNLFYEKNNITKNVIAYRPLGRGNYDFAAEAYAYAKQHSPVTVLAFDVTGFFDNLDHSLLKLRLKRLLATGSLSDDWYRIFRYITNFHFVDRADLEANATFKERLKSRASTPIATISEVKSSGIPFRRNPKITKGIPQGTPISAVLSNLYMVDFDLAISAYCDRIGALYRRYSDDILIICSPIDASGVESEIAKLISTEKLELSVEKTERTEFSLSVPSAGKAAQYLGFTLSEGAPRVRASSLSRQWRKMRRAIRRTRKIAEVEIAEGRTNKVYTKRLRRRFTPLQFRNFSSYARRSAASFGDGEKITRQIRRFEREVERQIQSLKSLETH